MHPSLYTGIDMKAALVKLVGISAVEVISPSTYGPRCLRGPDWTIGPAGANVRFMNTNEKAAHARRMLAATAIYLAMVAALQIEA